jgi:hypothetical protein
MPEDMRLFVKRLERDKDAIAELHAEIVTFLGEVESTVEKLNAIYRKQAA